MTIRRLTAGLAAALLLAGCASQHADVVRTTLTAIGNEAPAFTADLVDGGTFDLAAQRGNVVLVNFFATWCPPCKEEMPHLQEQVWERFRGDGFAMISVAREETPEVVRPFIAEYGAGWPFAVDPERTAFAAYADAFIPRNYVVDRSGRIVFQSSGYEEDEFAAMVAAIAQEMARPPE